MKKDQILKKSTKNADTVQPYVLLIETGEIFNAYVIINNSIYMVDSPLQAFDLCFKAFFSLNAKYPKKCEPVWLFIQKIIYNIDTIFDSNFNSVNELIAKVNAN